MKYYCKNLVTNKVITISAKDVGDLKEKLRKKTKLHSCFLVSDNKQPPEFCEEVGVYSSKFDEEMVNLFEDFLFDVCVLDFDPPDAWDDKRLKMTLKFFDSNYMNKQYYAYAIEVHRKEYSFGEFLDGDEVNKYMNGFENNWMHFFYDLKNKKEVKLQYSLA